VTNRAWSGGFARDSALSFRVGLGSTTTKDDQIQGVASERFPGRLSPAAGLVQLNDLLSTFRVTDPVPVASGTKATCSADLRSSHMHRLVMRSDFEGWAFEAVRQLGSPEHRSRPPRVGRREQARATHGALAD
jgi:hypothetical protein